MIPHGSSYFEIAVIVALTIATNSGVWAYIMKRQERNNAWNQLIRGLAHDHIVNQGMCYIERGFITSDEYDDFVAYLYTPYHTVGGNGTAEKVFKEVARLPMKQTPFEGYHAEPNVRQNEVHSPHTTSSISHVLRGYRQDLGTSVHRPDPPDTHGS